MIKKRNIFHIKILWLFIKHSFVKGNPEFLAWCFGLAKNKNNSWYEDKDLLLYLVETSIKYDDDYKQCELYGAFQNIFKEYQFPKKDIKRMEMACKKIHTPEHFSHEII